ncbi:MAG: aminopeptidase [Bacillota bacterium]
MTDPRIETLAKNLVHYSCSVKPGEKVLIEVTGGHEELVLALIKEIYAAGALPFVSVKLARIDRELLLGTTEELEKSRADYAVARMQEMQAYIGIRGGDNSSEFADVPSEKMQVHTRLYGQRVHSELRVKKTKWVVLRYPTPSIAQMAGMSTAAFEDFYFSVCNLDYSKMDKAMDNLIEWMHRTDRVHILGKGTDLTFSIKGIPAVKCAGEMNIPDGEVYTAPVRDSANGVIAYNTPSIYQGFTYENVVFKFENGRIVEASANDDARLNKILDTDEGARYLGEFALGVHPYITRPMKDILFDEKISGSVHITPGNCYENADNRNKSAVHWDLVLIQTPEYGGGEIWFDDTLVRKDGRFVPEPLQVLNPENLI